MKEIYHHEHREIKFAYADAVSRLFVEEEEIRNIDLTVERAEKKVDDCRRYA